MRLLDLLRARISVGEVAAYALMACGWYMVENAEAVAAFITR